jgi:hypothetical protein
MSINWIKPSRNSGKEITSYLAIRKYGKNEGKNVQTSFCFSQKAMEDLRLYIGDKVNIGYDEEYIYIKRSSNGAYKITCQGPAGTVAENTGKSVRGFVKTSAHNEVFSSCDYEEDEIISDDSRYTVVIPRKNK